MSATKLPLRYQTTRAIFDRLSIARIIWLAILLVAALIIAKGWLTPSGLEIFDEPGSAADWVAAIGTWVVGLAAFVLASGDRRLRLHERREQKMLRMKLEISQLRAAIAATISARNRLDRPLQYFKALEEHGAAFENAALYDVSVAFNEIIDVVGQPIWSAEDRATATDSTDLVMSIAIRIANDLAGRIAYINDNFMQHPRERAASENEGVIRTVSRDVRILDGTLGDALNGLVATNEALAWDRDRLAAQLRKEFEELI
ncbi:hypothetical protein CR156_08705 [Stenotrophomonas lactitubi]|uniref:hypothetical protein n=1 Tax=Stenotrophomonas lactitubi TaxID=2045214 RepID=UPI000C27F16C|nr:hypothetical protein [Stenotrophomonas lactitubi]PJO52258.1 hypothetical protein CR156_08705 [Stenotrophomonas lactitubi]